MVRGLVVAKKNFVNCASVNCNFAPVSAVYLPGCKACQLC